MYSATKQHRKGSLNTYIPFANALKNERHILIPLKIFDLCNLLGLNIEICDRRIIDVNCTATIIVPNQHPRMRCRSHDLRLSWGTNSPIDFLQYRNSIQKDSENSLCEEFVRLANKFVLLKKESSKNQNLVQYTAIKNGFLLILNLIISFFTEKMLSLREIKAQQHSLDLKMKEIEDLLESLFPSKNLHFLERFYRRLKFIISPLIFANFVGGEMVTSLFNMNEENIKINQDHFNNFMSTILSKEGDKWKLENYNIHEDDALDQEYIMCRICENKICFKFFQSHCKMCVEKHELKVKIEKNRREISDILFELFKYKKRYQGKLNLEKFKISSLNFKKTGESQGELSTKRHLLLKKSYSQFSKPVDRTESLSVGNQNYCVFKFNNLESFSDIQEPLQNNTDSFCDSFSYTSGLEFDSTTDFYENSGFKKQMISDVKITPNNNKNLIFNQKSCNQKKKIISLNSQQNRIIDLRNIHKKKHAFSTSIDAEDENSILSAQPGLPCSIDGFDEKHNKNFFKKNELNKRIKELKLKSKIRAQGIIVIDSLLDCQNSINTTEVSKSYINILQNIKSKFSNNLDIFKNIILSSGMKKTNLLNLFLLILSLLENKLLFSEQYLILRKDMEKSPKNNDGDFYPTLFRASISCGGRVLTRNPSFGESSEEMLLIEKNKKISEDADENKESSSDDDFILKVEAQQNPFTIENASSHSSKKNCYYNKDESYANFTQRMILALPSNSKITGLENSGYSSKNEWFSDGEQYEMKAKRSNFQKKKYDVGIHDFQFLKMIGKGGYGTVWLVKKKSTSDIYAMKIINFADRPNKNNMENIKKEGDIFNKVSGDFVNRAIFIFTYKLFICFVMEYLPTSLSGLLEEYGIFDVEFAKFFIAETVLAIKSLHEAGIIHRDIKPDNILIDKFGHIKLTDFGLSEEEFIKRKDNNFFEESRKYTALKISTGRNTNKLIKKDTSFEENIIINNTSLKKSKVIGTPDYIAPEILESNEKLNLPSIDIWALGVMIFEFLVGVPPFNDVTVENIFQNIKDMRIPWDEIEIGYNDNQLNPIAYDLISKILNKNVQKRLTLDEVQRHPFFDGIEWESIRNSSSPYVPSSKSLEYSERNLLDPDAEEHFKVIDLEDVLKQVELSIPNVTRYDVLQEENEKIYKNFSALKVLKKASSIQKN